MQGLIIWAYSYCRSTLAFFIELSKNFGVAPQIYVLNGFPSARAKTGFSSTEFSGYNISFLNGNEQYAINTLLANRGNYHIFASYQKNNLHRKLISVANEEGIRYGIASEAPCNMSPGVLKHIIKDVYLKWILKHRVKNVVRSADFIINLSGYYQKELERIGWDNKKIISCGYFPPPIEGGTCVKRDINSWNNFTILLSGLHQWHRSPMLLIKALWLLQICDVKFKCVITQDGPLLDKMKKYVESHGIRNIDFLGFVPMEKLLELYKTCSVYVGAGNFEPWGMRLNDVLQCGAPLLVNRGMGGCKLVDDFGCGLCFDKGNYQELADKLQLMIQNKEEYLKFAENAFNAATQITPQIKAQQMAHAIQRVNPSWNIPE